MSFNISSSIFISCCSYYIGLKQDAINKRIIQIKLPQQMKRNLRQLSERRNFKASEWRTMGLYVGILILMDILPDR